MDINRLANSKWATFCRHCYSNPLCENCSNSLEFVPEGLNKTGPALVQIMAWHPAGEKTLFQPMMGKSFGEI